MEKILNSQRKFFRTGKTLDVEFRISYLKKLKEIIIKREDDIKKALHSDLGKSGFESYMCEIGLTLNEISCFIKNLHKFAKEKRVKTSLVNFPSKSFIKFVPKGNTLIISPWNYPFLLSIEPLVDAIAAGNTAILKPSAYSPNTSEIVKEIVDEVFDEEYAKVITGGREENKNLLSLNFDFVFFTGSQNVGHEVLQKCAEHLTPAVLELGGKSPCIVDKTADIKISAKRIVFGKFLNCGQTCVAPDYIYCDKEIKDELISEVKIQIKKQFGENPLQNENYGKIINEKHFNRILKLINPDKVVFGGKSLPEAFKIEPALLDNISWEDNIMKEEIFGPLLPFLAYENIDDVIDIINAKPHPLALYIFSRDKKNIKKATEMCRYGGGCINDVIVHLASDNMPFGGFKESGMGNYHGKFGFETFSHQKSILDKGNWPDAPVRYQPYAGFYEKLIKMFLK